MRKSILRGPHQVLRVCKASSGRTFTTGPSKPTAPFIPVFETRSETFQTSQSSELSQKRFQTTTATASSPSTASPLTSSPIPQTHYEFFPKSLSRGPPPTGSFRIDTRELRREFLQLQAVAHPDRHPHNMKLRAEATSARINEAYKTLQNPLLRAQYLLSLRGIDVAADETAKVEDPELLMEVLDAREEIESAEDEGELEEMKRVNEEKIKRSEMVLDEAFRDDDLARAKQEAVRLRYWVNIKESLDGWEKGKPIVLEH